MELLESDVPKRQLLRKSEQHRDALKEEAKMLSVRTEKAVINALVIGGALLTAYFLMKKFSLAKQKPVVRSKKLTVLSPDAIDRYTKTAPSTINVQGIASTLGAALANQATVFLLTLAKEKLFEYLQSSTKIKSNEHS